jgi:hypothetical protein
VAPVKFEIKARYGASVLFSIETESLKLAVELGVRAGADLYGADLGGADLYGADLRSANLGSANLGGADLRSANLGGANLRSANLYGANLGGADLYGADLRGANLRSANLRSADLRSANLYGADLYGANLYGGADKLMLVGERPFLQMGPLGSRKDILLVYLTDKGVYVRAGCFWNTLEEFRAAVIETHAGNNFQLEYQQAIAQIELHAKLWTPAAVEGST